MRVVFDTNVLLAGVFTRGVCEAVLDECLGNPEHAVVLSEYIFREFSRHAGSKFDVPSAEVRRLVGLLKSQVELVKPSPVPADSCRDPDDLEILGTLVSAKADCLVSGDRDLMDLKEFRTIPILSPRAFHDLLRLR